MSRCVTARSTLGWIVAESADAGRREPRDRLGARRVRAARRRSGRSSSRLRSGSTGSPAAASPSREPPRARVVVGEPVDVVIERVDAGRRDDPRLAHRAAEEVLEPRAPRHQLREPGDERAERAAEALREAERDRVEAARRSRRRDPERDGGVQQPRAVEVEAQVELAARVDDSLDLAPAARRGRRTRCACSRPRRRRVRGDVRRRAIAIGRAHLLRA